MTRVAASSPTSKPSAGSGFLVYFAAFFAVTAMFTLPAPYTKIEEAYGLQAVHDILNHGANVDAYDHHAYPGVVPRSFVGPLCVAAVAAPFQALGLPKPVMQLVVRIILGALTSAALAFFASSAARRFGRTVGIIAALLCVTQFHLLFYASRTLPNTFALIPTLFALGLWLRRRVYACCAVFAFAMAVCRGELVQLAVPLLLLEALVYRSASFWRLLGVGVLSTAVSIGASVAVDSFFWRRLLWPEGEVLYFNVVLNKSSEWGVSPWHWYFSSALPRALLVAAPLVPLSVLSAHARRVAVPALAFVASFSLLPHKELRFVMYAVPMLNVAAAVLLRAVYVRLSRFVRPVFMHFAAVLVVVAASLCVGFFAYASAHNYAGASALLSANEHALRTRSSSDPVTHIHYDFKANSTGASCFLEDPRIRYSKEDFVTDHSPFTHLVNERAFVPQFNPVYPVYGFERVQLQPRRDAPSVVLAPQLYVHERVVPDNVGVGHVPNLVFRQDEKSVIITLHTFAKGAKPTLQIEGFRIGTSRSVFVATLVVSDSEKQMHFLAMQTAVPLLRLVEIPQDDNCRIIVKSSLECTLTKSVPNERWAQLTVPETDLSLAKTRSLLRPEEWLPQNAGPDMTSGLNARAGGETDVTDVAPDEVVVTNRQIALSTLFLEWCALPPAVGALIIALYAALGVSFDGDSDDGARDSARVRKGGESSDAHAARADQVVSAQTTVKQRRPAGKASE